MIGRFRTARSWFMHPDRELMRRELKWLGKYVLRPTVFPILILAFGVSLCLTFYGLIHERPIVPVHRAESEVVLTFSMLGGIVLLGVFLVSWIHLLQRRALAPFRRERLRDLVMTAIGQVQLWPALFVAPTAWFIVGVGVAGAGSAAGLSLFSFYYVGRGEGVAYAVAMITGGAALALFTGWVVLVSLAIAAFVTSRILTRGGFFSVALWGSVAFAIVLFLPMACLALAFVVATSSAILFFVGACMSILGRLRRKTWKLEKAYSRIRRAGRFLVVTAFAWIANTISFFLRVAFGWSMFEKNLARLRSPRTWDRLLALAGQR